MEDENLVVESLNLQDLPIAENTLKMDVFQHMRIGVSNKENNCICDNDISQIFYCVPCKVSCCPKCSLQDHKTHLLIQKKDYQLEPDQINKCFFPLEKALQEGETFSNLENKRKDLLTEVEDTFQKIVGLAEKWKEEKTKQVNDIIDELNSSLKEIEDKANETKKVLIDFGNKHKKFTAMPDKNKDPHNTLFLIYYDLLNIPYIWSHNQGEIAKNIENNMVDYKEREKKKNEENVQKIHDILFVENDSDVKFLPLLKLKSNLKDFNSNKLGDIDQRMTKINKGIDSFKKGVVNSVNKYGDYKDIAKENNIFEHRKVKGADNLFSQRKVDGALKSDENYVVPSHPLKNKNDVILDNLLLNRNFTHVMTDLYDTYFRIPTIELQSSHADLKIKEEEVTQEGGTGSVKIIEGTNQVMIYDKKLNKIAKKTLKLLKNPHGYTKFPFGCRALLIGDKLYISGGKDEFKQYPNCLIYDKKSGKIKRIMDMRNPRCYHTMYFNRVFETLMVVGGENNDTVEIFDPLTNRWQQLPELNIPRSIPLFYFDEGRGNMYALFGIEGDYRRSNFTDTIEILDLTEIKQGWMKINYNNKARMDFKSLMNMYPLNDYLVLLYGGIESRNTKRDACVYNLVKSEMGKIDKNLMDELRQEAKTNKLLNNIVSSVSKASINELAEGSKTLK